MTDVYNKRCIECNLTQVSNPKYENHCLRCFIYKFPNNTISRNYKIKERYITDFIEEEFPNQFIFDKLITNGCSKRRPDAFKDCLTHSLIIEIDENQHDSYEDICENKRMMEIFQDLANRPIVFIRFNPDSYKNIKSCFKICKRTGVLILNNKKDLKNRLNKLKKEIDYHIDNIPDKELTIIKLYFDN